MRIFSKIKSKNVKRMPTYLLVVFVAILLVVALITAANNFMEYISIKEENEKLIEVRNNKLLEIDELKYYVQTQIDDEYKERMARLLVYCYPDEIIYYIE